MGIVREVLLENYQKNSEMPSSKYTFKITLQNVDIDIILFNF